MAPGATGVPDFRLRSLPGPEESATREARSKGSRSVFGPSVFVGGLGYPGQTTTYFLEKSGLLALPPKAARPENHLFLENVWCFGIGTPGLQKVTLLKKHFGIPLS